MTFCIHFRRPIVIIRRSRRTLVCGSIVVCGIAIPKMMMVPSVAFFNAFWRYCIHCFTFGRTLDSSCLMGNEGISHTVLPLNINGLVMTSSAMVYMLSGIRPQNKRLMWVRSVVYSAEIVWTPAWMHISSTSLGAKMDPHASRNKPSFDLIWMYGGSTSVLLCCLMAHWLNPFWLRALTPPIACGTGIECGV